MWRAVFPSALVLAGLLGRLGYAAANEAKPPTGKLLHVRVRAVDAVGKPIAGALIEFWQSGGEGRSWWTARRISLNDGKEVRTGGDGWATTSFSMAPDPVGYRGPRSGLCLTARANDYLVTRSGLIDAASSNHFEVVLTLRRLFGVEGRVLDQQGRPVAGATVFHTGNATPRTEVRTDPQGHFRIEGLPEGKSPMFVTRPGYHFHGQLVETSAKSQEQELRLLAASETLAPLRTLPPLRPHDEELKRARQVIRPLWEAALKSAGEWEKDWYCELYASLDPWAAYDYVNAHLSKASRNRFVLWKMPPMYAADPEEAMSVLESFDTDEDTKAVALLRTVGATPGLSRQQRLDLLDRATQHLRATTDPGDRVSGLSSVAVRLFKLGKAEEARKIAEIVTPLAKQLSPKTSAAACATAGEAMSLFDLPAGARLICSARKEGDEYCWMPALFHVAYRIARERPAEAERMATEALNFARRSCPTFYRREYNRDPTEEELAITITGQEKRLVPLCYYLVSTDAARAERMATAIHNPYLRAYAVGMVAKALASSDRRRARRLILQAYDILAEASRHPDHRWPQLSWLDSLPNSAAGLLPVVEEIDPTLVGECMWRAVSFRLYRPVDDFLVSLEPETNNASLAAFVARYDRSLARALLPRVDKKVVPAQDRLDVYWLSGLIMIDINEAMEKLRVDAASQGADASRCFHTASTLIRFLPISSSHRWDHLASRHSLWIPDNRYADDSSFYW